MMLNPYYVTGFVDGEGCFCVSFSPRRFKNVDWEVRPSFSISQNRRDRDILFKIKNYFGCGSIRPSRKDNTYKYEVRSLHDLVAKVIPHFEKYPLQTQKRKDFEILRKVVGMMQENRHLTPEGLREIARIVLQASPQGRRIYGRKKFSELVKV